MTSSLNLIPSSLITRRIDLYESTNCNRALSHKWVTTDSLLIIERNCSIIFTLGLCPTLSTSICITAIRHSPSHTTISIIAPGFISSTSLGPMFISLRLTLTRILPFTQIIRLKNISLTGEPIYEKPLNTSSSKLSSRSIKSL